jgi:hypothetical protein
MSPPPQLAGSQPPAARTQRLALSILCVRRPALGQLGSAFLLLAQEDDRGQKEMQSDLDQDHFISALAPAVEKYH